MKKLLASALMVAGFAMPSQAAINILVDGSTQYFELETDADGIAEVFDDPLNPTDGNDFEAELLGLGYNNTAQGIVGLELTTRGTVEFYVLGSESGHRNTFTANGDSVVTYTEPTTNVPWAAPSPATYLGTLNYYAPTVIGAGDWGFVSKNGAATVTTGTIGDLELAYSTLVSGMT